MTAALDPKQLQVLREALLSEREALLRRMAGHQGEATRIQHAAEVLKQANEGGRGSESDREVDLALTDRERLDLAQVSEALKRLEGEDDFGICVDCGADIAYERLRVRPQALRCVVCEGRHEGHRVETRGFGGARPSTL